MFNFKCLKGATRTVFLVGKFAFKIPRMYSWKGFLQGLIANIQERLWSKAKHEKLCPVLFGLPGGFLVVMPRTTKLTVRQFKYLGIQKWRDVDGVKIPVENKHDSFGWLNNRIVAVDYGS